MVLLAASICTKGGKVLVSRQFLDMPRSRVEGLLASFPKLISPSGPAAQHTTIATDDVRFVYQLLEDMYLVLITPLKSNIIQDIESLQLFARAVADTCGNRHLDEREVTDHAFELLLIFDEIISFGLREAVTIAQLRTIAAMDSNEERIQELITRNKEMEAREQMRLKAKQMEIERRQLARSSSLAGAGATHSMGISGARAGGQMPGGYQSSHFARRSPSPQSQVSQLMATMDYRSSSPVANLKTGMKLGAQRATADYTATFTPSVVGSQQQEQREQQQNILVSFTESVHISIEEKILATVGRDGGLQSMEVRGDLVVRVKPGVGESVRVALDLGSAPAGIQFKSHPNFDKAVFSKDGTLVLRDGRAYVPGQASPALKWRLATTEEGMLPLSINCWPTPASAEAVAGVWPQQNQQQHQIFDVTIEYDLLQTNMVFAPVCIDIPVPGRPTILRADGEATYDVVRRVLQWSLTEISAKNAAGSVEFRAAAVDPGAFFPVLVSLSGSQTYSGLHVQSVTSADGTSPVDYGVITSVTAEDFRIV